MSAACNPQIPRDQCTLDTCCISQQSVLHYQPSLAGNAAYAIIFAVLLVAQAVLLLLNRKTWGFFIGIACSLFIEIIGYIGRVLLHNNPFSVNDFIIYLVCLTIGPAFMMASVYLLMSRVIVVYGTQHSLVKPFWYTVICVTGDVISLFLQAAGAATAASGVKGSGANNQTTNGTNIMMAGLIFQLVATLVFAFLCAWFFTKVLRNKHDRNPKFASVAASWRFKGMLWAVAVATVTIFIRSVYRVFELKDGFTSSLATNETLFMVFEGPMMIVAGLALTMFHPGWAFQGTYGDANWGVRSSGYEKTLQDGSHVEMLPPSYDSASYQSARV